MRTARFALNTQSKLAGELREVIVVHIHEIANRATKVGEENGRAAPATRTPSSGAARFGMGQRGWIAGALARRAPAKSNPAHALSGCGSHPVPAVSRSASAASAGFLSFSHERFAGMPLASAIAAMTIVRPTRVKKLEAVGVNHFDMSRLSAAASAFACATRPPEGRSCFVWIAFTVRAAQ